MTTTYLLTGDVGGTNSRMGLYSIDSTTPLVVKYYRNQDFLREKTPGIFEKSIIAPFLQHCWEEKNLVPLAKSEVIACLAIAGPVRGNKVCMSNLHDIEIDGTAIAKQLYCPNEAYLARIKACKIINDFVAQGYGCLTLKPDEVRQLNSSKIQPDPMGPKVCVGAGTGLGECFLTPDDSGKYSCFPSEGGHVEYAPRNDLEIQLWKYLKEKFNYVNRISVERVVSGRGLANCYEFLAQEFPHRVEQKVHEEFLAAGDMQGKVVAENAGKGNLCEQAMNIMMSAYGCECGSAAIKLIPSGGLFVTGGLTPKNIKYIEGSKSPFLTAYYDKGRVKPVLENIPLYAVMVEDLGVRGAHKCAVLEYEKYHSLDSSAATAERKSSLGDVSSSILRTSLAVAVGALVGITLSKRK